MVPDLRRIRLIPPVETYPAVRRWAATLAGRMVLVVLFTLGLWAIRAPYTWDLGVILLAVSAFPARRRLLAALGTIYWLARHHEWAGGYLIDRLAAAEGPAAAFAAQMPVLALSFLAALLLGAVTVWALRRLRSSDGLPAVWWFYGGYAVAVFAVAEAPLSGPARVMVWSIVLLFGKYLAWIGYAIQDPPPPTAGGRLLEVASMRPFWMQGEATGIVPIPKGGAYLQRLEAASPEQLALCQLKGLKLLAWALMLAPLDALGNRLDVLGIIPLNQAFELSVSGTPLPWNRGWLSLVSTFLFGMLHVAVVGHVVIACVRMVGFQAPRNSYRPLSATNLAEFWNRYIYYFKELLVDHFFLPAYRRWFRGHPRVRLIAATFAAACLGNAYLHFFNMHYFVEHLTEEGVLVTLQQFQVFMVYCLLLAGGIAHSQLRRRGRPAPVMSPARQALATAQVLLFFCLIRVFGSFDSRFTVGDHFRFLRALIPGFN